MTKMIAVCEFRGSTANTTKCYEYLCEVPEGDGTWDLADYRFAVTYKYNFYDEPNHLGTKESLDNLDVVFVRGFKPLKDQRYDGELKRVVLLFTLKDFVAYAFKRKQIYNLREALEKRVAEMNIFDKIKSLGVSDPEITSMAEELKNLMNDK